MNTKEQTLVLGKNFASTGLLVALLAAAAPFATPTAQADIRVGIGLGVELPRGYVELNVGRDHYYEHHGVFYQRGPRGYVVVRAPRGALGEAAPATAAPSPPRSPR